GQVLVNGGQRGQVEAPSDFFEAWRVAMLLDELVQVIQNLALPFRERKHGALLVEVGKLYANRRRKSRTLRGPARSAQCYTRRASSGDILCPQGSICSFEPQCACSRSPPPPQRPSHGRKPTPSVTRFCSSPSRGRTRRVRRG